MANKIQVKSILNKHKKRDDWFLDDYSINPYEACSFNCIYCYIRGSKYGVNMAKNLSIKTNAPELLERQLSGRARRGEYGIILISSATEAYMPIEKKLGLTRKLLEIIWKYKFPVHVITKSTLVLRDLDILKKIDEEAILPEDLKLKLKHGAIISFSLSTLDEKLAKVIEPGAPTPKERLETMRKCRQEGFLAGIDFIPVLPFLSDSDDQIGEITKRAKEYGANFILTGCLTLFGEGKNLYYKFLEKYYPELVSQYRRLFRIFSTPTKEYEKNLEEKSTKLCKVFDIAHRII